MHLKLFPNFTRHHLITHTDKVLLLFMIMPISRQTSNIEWSASIKQPLAGTPRVTVKWRFNCIYLVCLHLWCYLINLICKYFFNSLALIFTKGAVRIL